MMQRLRDNRWFGLAVLCIGFLMILIDTTIVNVSIPTIIKDLHASLTDIEWVVSGYALTFAALLITFGRLGDLFGRRRMFILGLVVFTISSFLCGEASSISVLILARLAQGIGGAMISPATLSIISSTFKGRERATAFGIWGGIAGIAVALGPILGGFFTTYYTWRWVFRVNIPIGIIAVAAAYLFIQESKEERSKHQLDISGMITSALGFFFLVFGLIEGQNYGWYTPKKVFSLGSWNWPSQTVSAIFASFVLSVIFLGVFIAIQSYKTKRKLSPAVDLDFFKFRSFRYGLIAIAVISLGEFSSLFTFPIFLQSIKGFTPLQSGYGTLPLALAIMVAAPLSARLVNVLGSKWVISTGIFLEFLGILLLSRLKVEWSYSSLVVPLVVLGAGIGLAIAQNTQVILSEISPQESGSASGVLNTIRQVGTALGIAIIGAILATTLTTNLKTELATVPNLPATAQAQIATAAQEGSGAYGGSSQVAGNQPAPPQQVQDNPVALAQYQAKQTETKAAIGEAIHQALAKSIAKAIFGGGLFVLVGAFLSLLIPSMKHGKEPSEAVAIH